MTVNRSALGALFTALILVLAARCGAAADDVDGLPEKIGFNNDVRPILPAKCFPCHGPDAGKRKADMRLDVRDSALAERKGVRAIVPGDPTASDLVRRIHSRDPDEQMPPPSSHRTLTSRDIAVLTKWIEQGAEYQPHWAYIPLGRPLSPTVKAPALVANPVDQFVLATLETRGLTFSPDADRRTLAPRLSFDPVGRPPSPDAVDAFASASDPAAYQVLVDRLLASPHYGERMATLWLDLVRFADTNGYLEDQHRHIYPYRDYVIRAFHDNVPFDQFTLEQIAGDLLPLPTLRARVASGYNRLNKVSTETGSQVKEFTAKYAADRVRTTASVWLGATLGCAECHDHKFDPYTIRDFYRFAAFFADIKEDAVPSYFRLAMPPELALPPPEVEARLDDMSRQRAALDEQRAAAMARYGESFAAARTRWEQAEPSTAAGDAPPKVTEWLSDGEQGAFGSGASIRMKGPRAIDRRARAGRGDLEFQLDLSEVRFPERSADLAVTFKWILRQSKTINGHPLNRPQGLSVEISRPLDEAISLRAYVDANDARSIELGSAEDVGTVRLRAVWKASKRLWSVSFGLNG